MYEDQAGPGDIMADRIDAVEFECELKCPPADQKMGWVLPGESSAGSNEIPW
jgi:hypothetical protein